MRAMFSGASAFTSDLSRWQTGKVTNMSYMFASASAFTSDLSQWQTGKVKDMREMLDRSGMQERPSWY
jgi:surface protein